MHSTEVKMYSWLLQERFRIGSRRYINVNLSKSETPLSQNQIFHVSGFKTEILLLNLLEAFEARLCPLRYAMGGSDRCLKILFWSHAGVDHIGFTN